MAQRDDSELLKRHAISPLRFTEHSRSGSASDELDHDASSEHRHDHSGTQRSKRLLDIPHIQVDSLTTDEQQNQLNDGVEHGTQNESQQTTAGYLGA